MKTNEVTLKSVAITADGGSRLCGIRMTYNPEDGSLIDFIEAIYDKKDYNT